MGRREKERKSGGSAPNGITRQEQETAQAGERALSQDRGQVPNVTITRPMAQNYG